MRRVPLLLLAMLDILAAGPVSALHAQAYTVSNLVSDGSVSAITVDPNFLNPWGISVSGAWWISTANSNFNYVISATTDAVGLEVVVPGAPAGSVTTSGASGMVLSNGVKAAFLFSTLDGAIYGWNGSLNTNTLVAINNSSAGASYPGLAIINPSATTSYILAPNFGAASKIEVYDQTFKPTTLPGSFTDPNLPSGYAPYSIHVLHNQVWVAYALRSSSAPYVPLLGSGSGIVDVFDTKGNFVARAVTGGNLNAPWGVAFAPSNFGVFSGDLLIGNFGDGIINVYDPTNYAYRGQLVDSTATPLTYLALWDLLTTGTPVMNSGSSSGGTANTVYFTAGLEDQRHGLLGAITNTSVPGVSPTFAFSSSTDAVSVTSGTSANITLAVVPVNGFNGTVTLSCTPSSTSTCALQPTSLNVSSSAVATSALTITANGSTTMMGELRFHRGIPTLALASLFPLSLLIFLRRRGSPKTLRFLGPLAILILSCTATTFFLACSNPAPVVTPHGNSVVTVTATSGNARQQASIALTVQ